MCRYSMDRHVLFLLSNKFRSSTLIDIIWSISAVYYCPCNVLLYTGCSTHQLLSFVFHQSDHKKPFYSSTSIVHSYRLQFLFIKLWFSNFIFVFNFNHSSLNLGLVQSYISLMSPHDNAFNLRIQGQSGTTAVWNILICLVYMCIICVNRLEIVISA